MANEVEIIVRARDLASATLEKIGVKAEETGGKFGPLGKAGAIGLGLVGGAAILAAAEGVKLASSFQSSMEQLATQAHVPQKDVDSLSQSVLGLAGKVGAGPESLSEALYHIESSFASTGIKGSTAMHLLETAAKGAKMGHADLVDVTNALDAAVVSGIPGVSNFDQAMGMLNATVGAGDMHMQDLANAFSTGAVATVKLYGLSLRDVGAALAVFGDNNIRGQLAGNQLRMSMQAMVMPIKGADEWLGKIGLTTHSLGDALKHGGMSEAVGLLHDSFKHAGISAKESGDYITHIFGRKAGTGLNILVDQFDRLKSKYKEIDKGAGTFGDSWAQAQKTFAQQWDQVKASVQAALIQLGLKLMPVLQKLLPGATAVATAAIGALTDAVDYLTTHSDVAKAAAIVIGGVLVIAFMAWAAAAASAALATLAATWPIIAIVAAIAIMAASLIYAYTHFQTFHDIVDAVGRAIGIAGSAFMDFSKWVIRTVAGAVAFVIDRFGDMAEFVGGILEHIPGMGGAGAALKGLGQKAHDAAQKIRDVAEALAGVHSKSIYLRVQTLTSAEMIKQAGGFHEGQAHGGIVGHAAGGGPRSGGTLVGEHGPEVVDLAPGSTVHSNPDTERLLGGGGGPVPVVLEINSGGSAMDDLIVQIIRKAVRSRGGNVQSALGT